MDPVSHVVMGRAVIAAVERRAGERSLPGLSLAAIAGALVPDIDCVAMPMGWDVYLRIHQVGTHSIVGACALGGVVGLGIHAVVRGPSARWLAGSAAAAALSHLLLDLISGATLAVGWPFTSRRNVLPLVTMAEPWLVAVFVLAGAAMWWQRRRLRHTACIALAAITLLLGVKAVLYVRAMQVVARPAVRRGGATRDRGPFGVLGGVGRLRTRSRCVAVVAGGTSAPGASPPDTTTRPRVFARLGVTNARHRVEFSQRARADICGRAPPGGRRDRNPVVGSAFLLG